MTNSGAGASKPGTPLVFFGDDWGRRPSTLQHIARPLLPTHPSVWVQGINHRTPTISARDLRRAVEKVAAMVGSDQQRTEVAADWSDAAAPDALVPPRILPWHNVALARRFNESMLGRDISSAAARHFGGRRPIVIASTPMAAHYATRMPRLSLLYYCVDEYAAMDGQDADVVGPAERRMLEIADGVLVTSASMLESKRPASGRIMLGPQGVNYDHFAARAPLDAEVAALPRPIIGFAGGIATTIDVDIVDALADRFRDGSIVLVGERYTSLGTVEGRPNVHVLPRRSYGTLPGVLQAFDVGIIPYVLNDWTRNVDPLKLLEYLASGIPVVTTSLPDVKKHASAARIASGTDEFVESVAAALRETGDDAVSRRRAYAAGHTWAHRAEALMAFADTCASHRTS